MLQCTEELLWHSTTVQQRTLKSHEIDNSKTFEFEITCNKCTVIKKYILCDFAS